MSDLELYAKAKKELADEMGISLDQLMTILMHIVFVYNVAKGAMTRYIE